jgi:L-lysine cyclodeaminase
MKTVLITAEDVHKIVQRVGVDEIMDALTVRLEKAFLDYSTKRVEIPVRSGFSYEAPRPGLVEWMPCYFRGEDVTIKVVGYHPGNPVRASLPTILSTLSAYDSQNGHLKYVLDATLITALRTGATSAIASKYLASEEAKTLGLIGTGMQAVTQLHAISRVRDVKRVLIYDINPEIQKSFIERSLLISGDIVIQSAEPDEIGSDSDIVCTATSVAPGAGPVFMAHEVRPDMHINAIGSDFPGKIEIQKSLLERATVIPDFRNQAIIEGECQQLESTAIGPELHELIKEPARAETMRGEITVFDSTGWALEDHVSLQLFVQFAEEFGLGQRVSIETFAADPYSPYQFLESIVLQEQ